VAGYKVKGHAQAELNALERGWAEGVEFSWHLDPVGRWTGWASYSYGTQYQRFSPLEGYAEADFSQPHQLNAVLTYALSDAWELGGRGKAGSGIPYTPLAGRHWDNDDQRWVPETGARNSERMPPYTRLDLRTQYTWRFELWSLALSYEMLNVFDSPNWSTVSYENDATGIKQIKQFPRAHWVSLEASF
jgi:hypothetical protein